MTVSLQVPPPNGSQLLPDHSTTSSSTDDIVKDFDGDIDVSNKLPTHADLELVAQLPVLDAHGVSHSFKSIYAGKYPSRRVLVIFIRHFFCGNCQEYIRALASSLTPETLHSLSIPTELAIIGCGQPELIHMYIAATQCPFPIYADPTRKLYDLLGMTNTLDLGPTSSQYMHKPLPVLMLQSVYQGLKSGRSAVRGGSYRQVGGEFLFQGGSVIWCHRMRNTRGHAEIYELRRALQIGCRNEEIAADDEGESKPPLSKRLSRSLGRSLSSSRKLGRSLSNKRQSWSRSRSRTGKQTREASVMGRLKEEGANGEDAEDAEVLSDHEHRLRALEALNGNGDSNGNVATHEAALPTVEVS